MKKFKIMSQKYHVNKNKKRQTNGASKIKINAQNNPLKPKLSANCLPHIILGWNYLY